MFSSNCCFLTCIEISQEAGQVVWYSHVFRNFPQFAVIHTIKGFDIVYKAEVDVFLELSCRSCLYIFEINSLSIASFVIIFFHSEGCLFTLLIVSFIVHRLLIMSHLFTLDWKKHGLESRLPGEISITSDMQMTPPLWLKVKKN